MKYLQRLAIASAVAIAFAVTLGAATAGAQMSGCGGMMGGGSHGNHGAAKTTSDEKTTDQAVRPVVVAGVQTLKIVVNGSGYTPSRIAVRKDMPVRLVFEQMSSSKCAAQVQSPSLSIPKTTLPKGEETSIEFTPTRAGTFEFTCGMEMLSGTIDVE